MTRLELLENSDRLKSQIRNIGRYVQHGLVLGVIVMGGTILSSIALASSYPMYILLGPSLVGAVFYAIVFGLAGGANQILAERIWGIECEQNIGTGMRDGFLIFIFFNMTFLPLSIVFRSMTSGWWLPPTPFQIIILILVFTTPVYLLLLGIIGATIASFLHIETQPVMPSDFVERSHTCPHCGARYYYGVESEIDGLVKCQNCTREFKIR